MPLKVGQREIRVAASYAAYVLSQFTSVTQIEDSEQIIGASFQFGNPNMVVFLVETIEE